MAYTQEEQESLDIDWFGVDGEKIIHVASAGGKLPTSVLKHQADTEDINVFFRGLPVISNDIYINPQLSNFVTFKSNEERFRYLDDFIFLAKRGITTYDKTFLGQPLNGNYHLVTEPQRGLQINELPTRIADIIRMTQINNVDRIKSTIDVFTIL